MCEWRHHILAGGQNQAGRARFRRTVGGQWGMVVSTVVRQGVEGVSEGFNQKNIRIGRTLSPLPASALVHPAPVPLALSAALSSLLPLLLPMLPLLSRLPLSLLPPLSLLVPAADYVVPPSSCELARDARSTRARVDADAASPDEVVGRDPGPDRTDRVPASGFVSLQSSMTVRRLD